MAGYSLNVQPVQMLIEKYFVEDNICSLIINVKPELKRSRDLLPIALPSSPAIANTHVSVRATVTTMSNCLSSQPGLFLVGE
jgi:hypothetical protein